MITDIPDASPSSQRWFWGGFSFLLLLWVIVAIGTVTMWTLLARQLSLLASRDAEHDGLPSFVDVELVRARRRMPPTPTIRLPPDAYLRPSDTFPDPTPTTRN
jgi:hypothetical protein